MNILTLDVETTTSNKGNPFDQTNKLVCVGFRWFTNDQDSIFYEDQFYLIQKYIDNADTLVGFNIKFDLHWLRNVGIDFSGKRIWDCQIGEFLLNNQSTPYPSLDDAAEKYGLPKKLDVVKTEYWDKGVDTDAIPQAILSKYLTRDLFLTEQVYNQQVTQFAVNRKMLPLFKLQCQDLLVLEEIEYNGIKFNTEKALQKASEIKLELDEIYTTINKDIGLPFLNLNSNDHLSAVLYGGTITDDLRIPVGVYKTGAKVGQTRYKIVVKEYTLPRLVTPLKGTETVKPGYWKVNNDVLRSLKLNAKAKKLVDLLNRYGELDKLRGTYLVGWSNLIEKMHWPKDMIHGSLNQCNVVTGRLSSSKPNLQNADPQTKTFCESRYKDI